MCAHHKKTTITNFSDTATILAARVHRHVFADIAVGAHHQPGWPPAIAIRLRRRAKRSKWMNYRSRADRCMAGKIDVGDQTTAITNSHVCTDCAIWADSNIFSVRGPGLDPSRRIDHARAHAPESIAPTSASATISPATFASPRYHHIDLRRAIRFM